MKPFKKHLHEQVISEAFKYHLDNNIPFNECVFRYGSEMFFEFVNAFRECHKDSLLENYEYSEEELELIESDLGLFGEYEGEEVPLDLVFEEETQELNKPKRGGPKKFYVFVKNPQTGNIKKITFGDTTGLSTKFGNPERKKSFAARHNCSDANDKTTPKYWACRANKYFGKTSAEKSGYW